MLKVITKDIWVAMVEKWGGERERTGRKEGTPKCLDKGLKAESLIQTWRLGLEPMYELGLTLK